MILQKLHFYFITQIRQVLSNSGAIRSRILTNRCCFMIQYLAQSQLAAIAAL